LRTLVHGRHAVLAATGAAAALRPALLAIGDCAGFRCWADHVGAESADSGLQIAGQPALAGPGDEVFHVALQT